MNGMTATASLYDFYICTTTIPVQIYTSVLEPYDFKLSGPAWERWFDIFRQPAQIKKSVHHGMYTRRRRDPARKCVKDACRWKRRRFVQRLAA